MKRINTLLNNFYRYEHRIVWTQLIAAFAFLIWAIALAISVIMMIAAELGL